MNSAATQFNLGHHLISADHYRYLRQGAFAHGGGLNEQGGLLTVRLMLIIATKNPFSQFTNK